MSKHPLAAELKKWADNPDAWQWQWIVPGLSEHWKNTDGCTVIGLFEMGYQVRLIPKRNMVPAHLVPDGWEVERLEGGYSITTGEQSRGVLFDNTLGAELLRHIDKEKGGG